MAMSKSASWGIVGFYVYSYPRAVFRPLGCLRSARLYLHAVRPRNFLSSAEDANRVRGCYHVCFPSVGGLEAGYT